MISFHAEKAPRYYIIIGVLIYAIKPLRLPHRRNGQAKSRFIEGNEPSADIISTHP